MRFIYIILIFVLLLPRTELDYNIYEDKLEICNVWCILMERKDDNASIFQIKIVSYLYF